MLITWLLDDDKQRLSPTEELAFRILDDMLLGSSSSVLYKALADSALGEEVINDGVDRSMLQMTFQVGMKGIQDEKGIVQTEEVIMQTLLSLAEEGFDRDDIQSSLNSFEFSVSDFMSWNVLCCQYLLFCLDLSTSTVDSRHTFRSSFLRL